MDKKGFEGMKVAVSRKKHYSLVVENGTLIKEKYSPMTPENKKVLMNMINKINPAMADSEYMTFFSKKLCEGDSIEDLPKKMHEYLLSHTEYRKWWEQYSNERNFLYNSGLFTSKELRNHPYPGKKFKECAKEEIFRFIQNVTVRFTLTKKHEFDYC